MFYVCKYVFVSKFVFDQFFDIKYCIFGVYSYLVFSFIVNQMVGMCKSDIIWSGFVVLVISNNIYFFILENFYI